MSKQNKLLLLIVSWLFSAVACLRAQDSLIWPGTKTPYPKPPSRYTPPPAGFSPVFVNHAGRHGSRFSTKAGSNLTVLALLQQADDRHALTAAGRQIKNMALRLFSIEKGNYENISLSGQAEQAGIGERMRSVYSPVFDGKEIQVAVTKKIRTQQSADAFLKAFSGYAGKIKYRDGEDVQENVLRFYDVSPAYLSYKKSKAVQSPLDSLDNDPRTKQAISNICAQLFKKEFAGRLINEGVPCKVAEKPVKINGALFTESLYDLYGVQFSIGNEMAEKGYTKDSIDFGIAFSEKDLDWFQFKNSAADFLEKGPGTNAGGIQVEIAAPLLIDFISTTDSAIGTGIHKAAVLRFTHAEAISPFAALMGIPEAASPAASIFAYDHQWKASSIIPMSANIQWILYTNGNEYLIKILLNERETALPVPTDTYPYYNWKEIRAYYLQKLRAMHTGLGEDMHGYLLSVH